MSLNESLGLRALAGLSLVFPVDSPGHCLLSCSNL